MLLLLIVYFDSPERKIGLPSLKLEVFLLLQLILMQPFKWRDYKKLAIL